MFRADSRSVGRGNLPSPVLPSAASEALTTKMARQVKCHPNEIEKQVINAGRVILVRYTLHGTYLPGTRSLRIGYTEQVQNVMVE